MNLSVNVFASEGSSVSTSGTGSISTLVFPNGFSDGGDKTGDSGETVLDFQYRCYL